MIRFSCPGCEATFNVSDDKAGKTGKCPKCSAQFTIPLAPDGQEASPPLPPPPVADGGGIEIAPCPKCGARLAVEAGDLGLEVECPTCRAVYPAEPAAGVRPRNSGSGSGTKKLSLAKSEDAEERPSRRRREEEVDEEDRPSRRSRRDDYDEEDERPRRKKKRRRNVESKRMTAIILAWLLGGFGAHKFYLGYNTAGIILLVGNICTCYLVLWFIPLIEMIIYISQTDDDFIDTYQVGQREWF